MKKSIIKKADIILLVVLLLLGVGSPFLIQNKGGEAVYAEVVADGRLLGKFNLSEDQIIVVADGKIYYQELSIISIKPAEYNVIVIESGKLSVTEADCSGQDCVKIGSIEKNGEIIACLPHKLTITIKGGDGVPDVVI